MENKDYGTGSTSNPRAQTRPSQGQGLTAAAAGPPPPLYADQLQPTQFPSWLTGLMGGGQQPSGAPGGMAPQSNFQMPDFSKLFSGLSGGLSSLLGGQGSLPGMGGQQTGTPGGMGLMSLIQGMRPSGGAWGGSGWGGGGGGSAPTQTGVSSTGPAGASTPGQNTNVWGKGWGWGR